MVRPKLVIRYSLLGLLGGIVAFMSLVALTSLGVVAVEMWFSEDGLLHRMSNGSHNLADSGIFFVFIGFAVIVAVRISTRLETLRERDRRSDMGPPH